MALSGVASHTGSDVRRFPCEGCGADLEFHIGEQALSCPHCGFVKALDVTETSPVAEQDLVATLRRRPTSVSPGQSPGRREFQCRSCAATIVFEGALTSGECAYCGAT